VACRDREAHALIVEPVFLDHVLRQQCGVELEISDLAFSGVVGIVSAIDCILLI